MRKPPPRPNPLARAPLVDRLNGWLEAAWERGICSRPSLAPEVLWGKALRSVPAEGETGGRSEADAADFRLRLDVLTDALQREAKLNSLGLTIAHGQLARVIRQRLKLGALWAKRPDLTETPIAPPIIVVGQMRAGTTRLHRLLCADPVHAGTRFCDSWHPVPERPDLRPLKSAMTLSFARQLDPWLETLHPFGANRADEELGWLAAALDHCAYEAQWNVPSFVRFSEERDPAPVYREFARILHTDAALRGNAAQPRVLKVPQFAEDLHWLLQQFPNARVVVARREHEWVEQSAASLIANQMTIQSDTVDLDAITRECRRKIALREQRMEAALASFAGPVAEIDFAALDRDWHGEMAEVYAGLGLTLTAQALAAMAREQARSAEQPHCQHSTDYGAFARA